MDTGKSPAVAILRALTEPDFPLLHKWLNEPHLRSFYCKEAVTLSEVRQKYLPRLKGSHPCNCLIAEFEGVPFGYVQWYLNSDFPDHAHDVISEPCGVSLDYYVGSTDHLGKHLGAAMLTRVVEEVEKTLDPPDRKFFAGHRLENSYAIACTRKAGFKEHKRYLEDGREHMLFAMWKTR